MWFSRTETLCRQADVVRTGTQSADALLSRGWFRMTRETAELAELAYQKHFEAFAAQEAERG